MDGWTERQSRERWRRNERWKRRDREKREKEMERNESKRQKRKGERERWRQVSWRNREKIEEWREGKRPKQEETERNTGDKEREEPWLPKVAGLKPGSPGCSCSSAPGKHHSLPFPHLETNEGHSFLCPSQATQQRAPESHPYFSVHCPPQASVSLM